MMTEMLAAVQEHVFHTSAEETVSKLWMSDLLSLYTVQLYKIRMSGEMTYKVFDWLSIVCFFLVHRYSMFSWYVKHSTITDVTNSALLTYISKSVSLRSNG